MCIKWGGKLELVIIINKKRTQTFVQLRFHWLCCARNENLAVSGRHLLSLFSFPIFYATNLLPTNLLLLSECIFGISSMLLLPFHEHFRYFLH